MKKLIRIIFIFLFFFGTFITAVGFLMNRMNIVKYRDKGISIPAYISDMETYKNGQKVDLVYLPDVYMWLMVKLPLSDQ